MTRISSLMFGLPTVRNIFILSLVNVSSVLELKLIRDHFDLCCAFALFV